jgi:hypothetical protein
LASCTACQWPTCKRLYPALCCSPTTLIYGPTRVGCCGYPITDPVK